jgi:hypothetical protein
MRPDELLYEENRLRARRADTVASIAGAVLFGIGYLIYWLVG